MVNGTKLSFPHDSEDEIMIRIIAGKEFKKFEENSKIKIVGRSLDDLPDCKFLSVGTVDICSKEIR